MASPVVIRVRCYKVQMDGDAIVADLYPIFREGLAEKQPTDPVLAGAPTSSMIKLTMRPGAASLVVGQSYDVTISETPRS